MSDAIEIGVTQIDYTEESDVDGTTRPVEHLFGRDDDGELVHIRATGHRPYFYVPTEEAKEKSPAFEYREVEDVEHGFESIRGTAVSRVYTQLPRHVGQIRDDFEEHFEADILFPNRLMIDHDIQSGVRVEDYEMNSGVIDCTVDDLEPIDKQDTPMRIHHADIEVDDRNGFPENGEEEIICLTSWDSFKDEYILWLYNPPEDEAEEIPDDFEPMDDSEYELRSYASEERMMYEYLDYIENTDPDHLVGWNFADFDAPYIINRLKKLDPHTPLDLDPARLSRLGEAWIDSNSYTGPTIKGRVVFDLLRGYKQNQFSEEESYRLEAIGQKVLDAGKEVYTGKIGDLWEEELETLIRYSIRDVELTVGIDKEEELIDFWRTVASFAGCKIEDAPTASDAVDMYVLHKAFGDYVLPSKGTADYEDYDGGAVFEPISGVEEMVTVLDLASLYPMSMVTLNLSPETPVDPEEYDGDTYVAPNGQHFRKEPDGMIREMVDEMLEVRNELKDKRDSHDPSDPAYKRFDKQQASVKVVMNSLYGTLGWERFRLYDKKMGAAVTATGREVIEFTEQVVEEMGYDVTYGDTDSVMIGLKDQLDTEDVEVSDEVREARPDWDEEQLKLFQAAMDQSFEFEEHINKRYDEFAQEELNAESHRFDIEFEKLYKRYFQAGKKKRYAGHIIWKEGKFVDNIDITGFEYVRSDIPQLVKELQFDVIEMILRAEDKSAVKDYVKERIDAVKAGDVSLEKIGDPGGIGKKLDNYDNPSINVLACIWSNLLLGKTLQQGDKPKRVYLERVDESFFHKLERRRQIELEKNDYYREFKVRSAKKGNKKAAEKCAIAFDVEEEIPEEFEIDYEKMLEKVEGPISRVLEPMGITWEDVMTGTEQTGLGQW